MARGGDCDRKSLSAAERPEKSPMTAPVGVLSVTAVEFAVYGGSLSVESNPVFPGIVRTVPCSAHSCLGNCLPMFWDCRLKVFNKSLAVHS